MTERPEDERYDAPYDDPASTGFFGGRGTIRLVAWVVILAMFGLPVLSAVLSALR